ncbi:MAG: VOC family protein [Deltaproteobacteria bacterium]|nr:VOC family protein [Deltaproteobacteria bacterium]
MSEQMIFNPGRFVWHEIYTSNVEQTKAFYGELLNWGYETVPMQGMAEGYTMAKIGDRTIAGIMSLDAVKQMSPDMMKSMPPHWTGYVSVNDVDVSAATAKASGGYVPFGPMDIPNVGRFAPVMDPQGTGCFVFKALKGDGPEPTMPTLGDFCWDSLQTTDMKGAADFYGKVMGWTGTTMANMPGTTIFVVGDKQRASMHMAPDGMPANWMTYMLVENLERATEKATRLGAKVMMPNVPVPGMGKFTVISDSVGAVVALFEGQPA